MTDSIDRFVSMDLPVPVVADAIPDSGPAGGIFTGLGNAKAGHGLVVGYDMPFLSPALLAHMAALPRDYQALVPEFEGRLRPLHAIYAESAVPVIYGFLAKGGRDLDEMLALLEVTRIADDEIRQFDPQGYSFFEISEPADIERLAQIRIELENSRPSPSA